MRRASLAIVVLGLLILIAVMAISSRGHDAPSETNVIEEGYDNAVRGLYRHLFDTLITYPPGDEAQATANFKKGLATARKARQIALENVQ